MSRIIFTNKTVDFKDCELVFTNCKLRMENCKLTNKLVRTDEHSRVICENQSLKEQIEHLKAEIESWKQCTEKCEQTIKLIDCQKRLICEETAKISRKRSGSF